MRSGKKLGVTGKKFKHVVNIGIGGSDLGPLLVCDALQAQWSGGLTPHFVSNVDRTQLEDLIRSIDPAETLVIVCSKTFTTQETQANANAARAWIVGALGEKSPANHFVAVSTNASAMDAFGISPEHRFTMWDWVGGRYSVWSAIGLVAELVIGSERFQEFLQGASDMDRHFTQAPFEKNLPVLMGLLGVWNRTFLNLPTLAVLPYDQRLARLPAYLQQLEMESNGKTVSLDGRAGGFRDRTHRVGRAGLQRAALVLSNAAPGHLDAGAGFHRAAARLVGRHRSAGSRAAELLRPIAGVCIRPCTGGRARPRCARPAPSRPTSSGSAVHRVHDGNRPSSLLLYPQTTARTLGGLLALYEHSVFVQGTRLGRELLRSVRRGARQETRGGHRHVGREGAGGAWCGGIGVAHRLCGEASVMSCAPRGR